MRALLSIKRNLQTKIRYFFKKQFFFENHENGFYPQNDRQVKRLKFFRHTEEIVSSYKKVKTKLGVLYLIFCCIQNVFNIKKGL